jgi:hypothetical protein
VVTEVAAHPIVREAPLEQRCRLGHDVRVAAVEGDPQALGACESADVPVAEVEPEKLGIVGGVELHRGHRLPAALARRRDAGTGVRSPAPVPDRGPRQPEPPGDLGVRDTALDQLAGRVPLTGRSHEHMFA